MRRELAFLTYVESNPHPQVMTEAGPQVNRWWLMRRELAFLTYVESNHPQVNRGRWWLMRRELAFLTYVESNPSSGQQRQVVVDEERTGIPHIC